MARSCHANASRHNEPRKSRIPVQSRIGATESLVRPGGWWQDPRPPSHQVEGDQMTIRRTFPAMQSVGRRRMLQGAGLSALALGSPTLLSACGTESQVQSADTCKSTDKSEEEKELVFSNWPEYIDISGKRMPTLEQFETETGIDVTYNTDINDNAEFFGKVKDQLGSCESIGRDIITMTDETAGRMIGLGWMQKLDKENLPNVEANLIESLRSPGWDSDREYSVPWQAGLTGMAYNAEYTEPVSSFEELVTREDLKG